MKDIKISQMMAMQKELYEVHKHEWSPREPKTGRDFMLFLTEELGEAIAIIKKKGDQAVSDDPEVRSHFTEEMADVLMYYTEILICHGITPEEIATAYRNKHIRNMGRNYKGEYEHLFEEEV